MGQSDQGQGVSKQMTGVGAQQKPKSNNSGPSSGTVEDGRESLDKSFLRKAINLKAKPNGITRKKQNLLE